MQTDQKEMKILLVASEVAPFAKTGGLADVAGALPKVLKLMGHDIRIVLPRYQVIEADWEVVTDFGVNMPGHRATAVIKLTYLPVTSEEGTILRIPVYMVENYHYFDRPNIYMHHDEAERYAFFCKAVLEMLPRINWQPDVLHCNDWQSGPIPYLLKRQYQQQEFYRGMGTLFTIHNVFYQGHWSADQVPVLGVGYEDFNPEGLEFYGGLNFMKIGIVYADLINTVSRRYVQEIQTPEFGERMEGLLIKRANDLYGIVNGIDYDEFNPATDSRIYVNYDADNIDKKLENRRLLQQELGLPASNGPVIGLISRLVDQKGLDLLEPLMEQLVQTDAQLVIQGLGDPHYEQLFRDWQKSYPHKISANICFDVTLAQRIYAGSDMFLMPSRFEPCGLGQLIALRFGTIPIVRSTGGLADTVLDYAGENGNGFVFAEYTPDQLMETINRAITLFHQPKKWQDLVERAMLWDSSWYKSALEYEQLYKNISARHKRT